MIRLIDADALRRAFDVKCVEECACCPESSGHTVMVGGIKCKTHDHCGLLDNAPTIDAIPVEWILENTKDNYDYSGTIARGLISEWRKEQEAKT